MWHRCKCVARKKPTTVISELYFSDRDKNNRVKVMVVYIIENYFHMQQICVMVTFSVLPILVQGGCHSNLLQEAPQAS